jgi:stress response protein SCP2
MSLESPASERSIDLAFGAGCALQGCGMSIGHEVESHGAMDSNRSPELKEVVFGLHWDPPHDAASGQPADLDALCVLFDSNGLTLEVIHPGHPRSVDGCVTHTGDSRNGASHWDDERIFVFLDALPEAVAKLAFVVMSATGKSFDAVPGARCHVSDRVSEAPHVQIELGSLCGRTIHTVSLIRRSASGWEFFAEDVHDDEQLFAELERRVRAAK